MIATSSVTAIASTPQIPVSGADHPLREAVIRGLRHSGYSSLVNVTCEVSEGEVVVVGDVPSFYLKQMAQTIILRIGQIRVKNNLKVQEAPYEVELADSHDLCLAATPGYEAA